MASGPSSSGGAGPGCGPAQPAQPGPGALDDIDISECLRFDLDGLIPNRTLKETAVIRASRAVQRLVKAVLEVGFPSVDEARRRKLQDRMCLLLAGMVTADGRMDIAQEFVKRVGERRKALMGTEEACEEALKKLEKHLASFITAHKKLAVDFFKPALSMYLGTADCLLGRSLTELAGLKVYTKLDKELELIKHDMEDIPKRYELNISSDNDGARFKKFMLEQHHKGKAEDVVGFDAAGELQLLATEKATAMLHRWKLSTATTGLPPTWLGVSALHRKSANMLAGLGQLFPAFTCIVERPWNFTPELHTAAVSAMTTVRHLVNKMCLYEACDSSPHPAVVLAMSDSVAALDILDHAHHASELASLDKGLATASGLLFKRLKKVESELKEVQGSQAQLAARTDDVAGKVDALHARVEQLEREREQCVEMATRSQAMAGVVGAQRKALDMMMQMLKGMGAGPQQLRQLKKVLIESDEAAVAASTSIDVQRQIPSAMSAEASGQENLRHHNPIFQADVAAATRGMAGMRLNGAPRAAPTARRSADQRTAAAQVHSGAASGTQLHGPAGVAPRQGGAGAAALPGAASGSRQQPASAARPAAAPTSLPRSLPASQAARSSGHSGIARPPAAGPPPRLPATQSGARPSAQPAPVELQEGAAAPHRGTDASLAEAANGAEGATTGRGGPSRRRPGNTPAPQANSRRGR